MKCQYCDEPFYTDMTGTPVCLKHYEAILLASRVTRQGKALTLSNVQLVLARQLTRLTIQMDELKQYIEEAVGPIEAGDPLDPAAIFNDLGGFFWSDSKRRAGFRSDRGCRVFGTLFPDWEAFVI